MDSGQTIAELPTNTSTRSPRPPRKPPGGGAGGQHGTPRYQPIGGLHHPLQNIPSASSRRGTRGGSVQRGPLRGGTTPERPLPRSRRATARLLRLLPAPTAPPPAHARCFFTPRGGGGRIPRTAAGGREGQGLMASPALSRSLERLRRRYLRMNTGPAGVRECWGGGSRPSPLWVESAHVAGQGRGSSGIGWRRGGGT